MRQKIEMSIEIENNIEEPEVIKPVVKEKHENKEEPVMILPMSRIKKIIKLDPEHISSTESANFVLGLATELFIKQLAIDSSEITKSKGRKKIMYADAQKVVGSADIYSFLRDIVPKRAPIGELMTKGLIKLRPKDQQKMEDSIIRNGYRDLDEEEDDVEEIEEEDGDGEADGEVEAEVEVDIDEEKENRIDDEDVEEHEIKDVKENGGNVEYDKEDTEEIVENNGTINETVDDPKRDIKDADGDIAMNSNVEIIKDED